MWYVPLLFADVCTKDLTCRLTVSGAMTNQVRMRPDAKVVRPLPHIIDMFEYYRNASAAGRSLTDQHVREQFGGLVIPQVEKTGRPLLADVVAFDDQFAIASRHRGAEPYFLGAQKVFSKCYNESSWAIACSKPVTLMRGKVSSRVEGCAPIRLISAEFDDVIIRDCGMLQDANFRCENVAEARRRGTEMCMMTTDHWRVDCGKKGCKSAGTC